jgi:hypothetical protein
MKESPVGELVVFDDKQKFIYGVVVMDNVVCCAREIIKPFARTVHLRNIKLYVLRNIKPFALRRPQSGRLEGVSA